MRILAFVFLLLGGVLKSQSDPIIHSVFLIGDVGRDTIPSEAMFLLAFEAIGNENSSVVLLGDNVYPQGNMPKANEKRADRILLSQLELFSTYTGSFFIIPGNHDWRAGKVKGLQAIKFQEQLSNDFSKFNSIHQNAGAIYLPNAGRPGPHGVDLGSSVKLIMLDSQWWLQHDLFHPVDTEKDRTIKQEKDAFLQALDSLLLAAESQNKLAIVVGHHPLYTNGSHSHRRQPLRFLFNYTPLHLFSWLGLNRLLRQDIVQPRYKKFRKSMREVLTKHPNTIYASGHDHNMQYLKDKQVHHIVSGSGAKNSPIDRYRYPARFMDDQQNGFFRVNLHASGAVTLEAYGVRERGMYWKSQLFYLPVQPVLPK